MFISVGSIQAADTNDTADVVCEIEPDSSQVVANPSIDEEVIATSTIDKKPMEQAVNLPDAMMATKTSSSKTTASKVKTYTDLANEIDNARSKSVLVLKGTYKYNPKKDKSYKYGVSVPKSMKIVGKKCVIDGRGKATGLVVHPYKKVTLDHITFRNCYNGWGNGGAVFAHVQSTLIIKNCVFKNNKVYKGNGGAIANGESGALKIYKSKFYNNKAIRASAKKWPSDERGMGGAIHVNPGTRFILHDSVFKKNYGYLTIILVMSYNGKIKTSTAHVQNCLFERNTAEINGVFYLDEYSKGTFIKSTFKNNVARKDGGTLILDAAKYAKVKSCRFIGNTGYVGAAIDLFKFNNKVTKASIVGCTFLKNKAKESGGAIYSDLGTLAISKCTFKSNKAGTSGGSIWTTGTLSLKNSVFKSNRAMWGGAVLLKNKNYVYMTKTKFTRNVATRNGPNIYALNNNNVAMSVKILR